jgi:hypothetical protein
MSKLIMVRAPTTGEPLRVAVGKAVLNRHLQTLCEIPGARLSHHPKDGDTTCRFYVEEEHVHCFKILARLTGLEVR